jgi:hypothetical protein
LTKRAVIIKMLKLLLLREDLEKAKELFVLITLSKQVIEYKKLINKRIVKKKWAFVVKYNI